MSTAVDLSGRTLPIDDRRGTLAMTGLIVTEALLFVMLFFAYYYLGYDEPRWPPEPPKLTKALPMLAILLTSSGVLLLAERRTDRPVVARLAIAGTIALGIAFLAMQAWEYHDTLKKVQPSASAYGSIFFTLTGVHGAHVCAGLLMMAWVLLLPSLDSPYEPPHRPLHNAALYWHFVDAVWIVIVLLLYLVPNWRM